MPPKIHSRKTGPGFAVLYRWRLKPGMETQFIQAWSGISRILLDGHGSLGSRLHRGNDGIWYSYAQWPSASAREAAFVQGPADIELSDQMRACVAESFDELILESVADFMVNISAD